MEIFMGAYLINQSTTNTSQLNSEIQQNTSTFTSIGLFAATSLPFVLICGIIAYKKYRIFTWRQRVAKLEKAWSITAFRNKNI
jgi:cytochrome b